MFLYYAINVCRFYSDLGSFIPHTDHLCLLSFILIICKLEICQYYWGFFFLKNKLLVILDCSFSISWISALVSIMSFLLFTLLFSSLKVEA